MKSWGDIDHSFSHPRMEDAVVLNRVETGCIVLPRVHWDDLLMTLPPIGRLSRDKCAMSPLVSGK